MSKKFRNLAIALAVVGALLGSIVVMTYYVEITEMWSADRQVNQLEKTVAETKRMYVTTLWGLYMILVGTYSAMFLLDIFVGLRVGDKSALLNAIRSLRSAVTFQVAMWSTASVAEIVLNWSGLVDSEKYGRVRVFLSVALWIVKSLEGYSWHRFKVQLKSEIDETKNKTDGGVEHEKQENAQEPKYINDKKERGNVRRRSRLRRDLSTIDEEEEPSSARQNHFIRQVSAAHGFVDSRIEQ